MRALFQDIRYGARLLSRAPGFAVVAIAALAIGIGANTAIFSVVNTLLLQRLPYADPDRLAVVWEHNLPRDRKNNVVSPGNFIHWREMNQVFEDIAAAGDDVQRHAHAATASPRRCRCSSSPRRSSRCSACSRRSGRWLHERRRSPGSRVVVISDRLWRARFGGDPGILQRAITLQGEPLHRGRRHAARTFRFSTRRSTSGCRSASLPKRGRRAGGGCHVVGAAEAGRDRSSRRSRT